MSRAKKEPDTVTVQGITESGLEVTTTYKRLPTDENGEIIAHKIDDGRKVIEHDTLDFEFVPVEGPYNEIIKSSGQLPDIHPLFYAVRKVRNED